MYTYAYTRACVCVSQSMHRDIDAMCFSCTGPNWPMPRAPVAAPCLGLWQYFTVAAPGHKLLNKLAIFCNL